MYFPPSFLPFSGAAVMRIPESTHGRCSGERSSLAPPPYNVTVCVSVSQNSTGGVGVDSNVTVCLCVSQNSTGGVGVDSNVTVLLNGSPQLLPHILFLTFSGF